MSNDGTSDTDYASAIAAHQTAQGKGAFLGGSTYGYVTSDFGQTFDPLNGLDYAGAPGSYTVEDGDTLASIAQGLWGDASLWYKLADANGMDGTETLVAGQDLVVPTGVVGNHNTSSTYRVYDPNDAIGNVSPIAPRPQAAQKHGCGVFGQILLAVVALAVTVINPLGASPVVAALIGDAASQVVGLATGIQQSFDWKELALTAVTVAVGSELGSTISKVGDLAGNKFLGRVIDGALTNAIAQGIEVATGLQDKFDWAAVAGAGIGAGIGGEVHVNAGSTPLAAFASHFASSAASGLANAATRSLIAGTDFGDNIIAALPDVLAQTVGGVLQDAKAGRFKAAATPSTAAAAAAATTGPALGVDSATQVTPVAGQGGGQVGQGNDIIVTGQRHSDWTDAQWAADAARQAAREADEDRQDQRDRAVPPLPEAPHTDTDYAIDFATHNARLAQWGPWIAQNDPTMTKYDYTDIIAGFNAEEDYILSVDAAAAPELNRVDMVFGGIMAACTAPLSVPLLTEGGIPAALGWLGLSADTNHALGAGTALLGGTNLGGTKLPLDYIAGDGASTVLDVGAASSNLLYGGYRGLQSLGSVAAETGPITQSIGDLRSLGLKDAHHVIQDAAVRDLEGYNTRLAPGVQLEGPSTLEGSPHYNATQAQRVSGGGTYGAERKIAYDALRAAGHTDAQATQALREADAYFNSIGVTESTPTRIPGNRPR